MLKEIFNKEEKSEEEKTKEINQKTLIYLIIFVVGISFYLLILMKKEMVIIQNLITKIL